MTSEQRMQLMRERLQAAFSPSRLEIVDDSARHAGHVGASGGAGHYILFIAAENFSGQSRVVAHRAIYSVIEDLMPHEVHALQIKIV